MRFDISLQADRVSSVTGAPPVLWVGGFNLVLLRLE
jgi:hypothetical protein